METVLRLLFFTRSPVLDQNQPQGYYQNNNGYNAQQNNFNQNQVQNSMMQDGNNYQHLNYQANRTYNNAQNVQNNQLVVDFIASMTDDYFYELAKLMYPDILKENNLEYVGYFNDTIKDERDPNNNKKRIDVYIKELHG